MQKNFSTTKGFTLIEILIAIATLMTIVGLGIAAFIRFNERQTLIQAAREMQVMLRSAQRKASVGEVPADCDDPGTVAEEKLQAYRVSVTGGVPGSLVSMFAMCGTSQQSMTAITPARDTYQLPAGISAVSSHELDFFSLHGGVDVNGSSGAAAESVTIALSNEGGLSYIFDVTKGGEITTGAIKQ